MSTSAPASRSVRDALYEAPGPRTRRRVRIATAISLILVVAALAAIGHRFYITGQFAPRYWTFFAKATTWKFLLQGFAGTVRVALTAGAIALALGLLLMLGRISHLKALSAACRVVTDFFRSLPQYGIKMSSFWMLTLPVALAASGVLAEVFRAGVNAVPKGQIEAALSLGMSPLRTTLKIVLPQAIRFVIPSLISQLVVVVKDTTVAYVVSYPDLMQNARVLITNYDALVSVYFTIAIIYILINYAINQASIYVSHRLGVKIIR